MPRDEGTYYLDINASDVGLGAVLSQDQGGKEVVWGYASRTLWRTERNYVVTRRELLVVVYELKTYRQYLLGRHFVIRTDHSALQSLRRTAEPIGQQARWQTFIEKFTFTIVYRQGTKHRNADALSRRPFDEDNSDREDRFHCAMSKTSKNEQSTQDVMVWYGMVNVDLYSTIVTKVSNALNTLVPRENQVFRPYLKDIVLLCAEIVRQRVPDQTMRPCTANARRPTMDSRCRGTTISCCVEDLRPCLPTTSVTCVQQSTRYCGALPCRHLCMMTPGLYVTRSATSSQCRSSCKI